MDNEHFEALKKAKSDNYALIYKNDIVKNLNTNAKENICFGI